MKRYFIRRPRYIIEPEEILLDAHRFETPLAERMEFAVPERSFRVFFAFGVAALAALFAYSAYLGTVKHEFYAALAESNRLRPVFEQAPRGVIYDRFGVVLAANKEVFDVTALPLALPKEGTELRDLASGLAAILGTAAEETFEKLVYAKNLSYAEPVSLWTDIPREKAVALEKAKREFPGIKLAGRYIRTYPQGPAFSHLLGYTGAVTKEELERLPDAFLKDAVGRAGVEEAYDAFLRGKKGKEEIEVNATLEIVDMRRSATAEPGLDLRLTIDAGLQKALYDAMRSHMLPYGYERGAAVALDPKTGEILALVSLPSYDNNLFAQGIGVSQYSALLKNPSRPLFNRVVQGTYSPGSTIKPLLAVAALEEHIVKPDTLIDASRGYITVPNPYDPEKPSVYRDWRAHGRVDIRRAIAWSSNVYFYIVGGGYEGRQGLGIARIKDYLERFGFGVKTGVDLPGEVGGLVPDPEWKRANRSADPIWRIGDTYITSIGQGDVLMTPLQLAVAHAAIANGGIVVRPYVAAAANETTPIIGRALDILPENIKVVQEGMRLTIAEGSARSLTALPFETAGKTGTVQVASGRTNAVFSVYGPIDDPRIELVVIVENGGEGSSTAVPISRDVLWWYWENRLL